MEHVGKHVWRGPRLVRVAYAGPRLGLMDVATREVVEVEIAAFEAWAAESGVELDGEVVRMARLGIGWVSDVLEARRDRDRATVQDPE